jgi:hypothetical protein
VGLTVQISLVGAQLLKLRLQLFQLAVSTLLVSSGMLQLGPEPAGGVRWGGVGGKGRAWQECVYCKTLSDSVPIMSQASPRAEHVGLAFISPASVCNLGQWRRYSAASGLCLYAIQCLLATDVSACQ